ncbi:MAG: carboxypeptidase regulatory-like domain-containing protein [Myxococcaceae bacterium]|nr:carboxypeptidase regulatory-like domain-containing protein [Myxococcaceae bacterium]
MRTLRAGLVVGLLLTVAPTVGWAQSSEASVSSAVAPSARKRAEELFEIRLRYGLAYRTGRQVDATGPGLSYDGLTPNDPGLHAWLFPLFDGLLGFTAGFSREGFALFDRTTNARITGGGLFRAQAGVTARFRLGPARLEPVVGYSLAQLAEFTDSAAPSFRPATRHGLLLAARGLVDLGPVTIEGRFEYPLALAATDGAGARATSQGLWVGGGVRVALFRTGLALWGVMLDGAYSADRVVVGALDASQSHIRGGASIDLQWKEPEASATLGALSVSVQLDDGSPATKARVTVQSADGEKLPAVDEAGRARVDDLTPGTITVRVALDGYVASEQTAGVTAGAETPVAFRLQKEAPKVGSLVVSVVDKQTRAALAGAQVKVGATEKTTDATGSARFEGLTPGAVSVDVSAAGFSAVSEGATVLPAVEGKIALELVSAKKREPATVSGFVRSARGGAAVTANLELPEAGLKAKADDKGAFVFRLPGGTYTVTISAKGFVTQTKQVTVKDGDQAIFNVDLQPK